MSLFNELKRRNVLRVGAAYVVASWLLIQVAETIFPLFGFGDTPARIVVIVLAIGLIPCLIFAWVFEITPEGLKKDAAVDREKSIARTTGKKLDRLILLVLALALAYFAFDKYVLDPTRDAELVKETTQKVRTDVLVESYGGRSIAVLPFINMSSDPEQEYFSDGISEELLNVLTKVPELRVISRSSAFSFKGTDVPITDIAKQLNVAHVLSGSVRKAENRVRITAQLVDARSDTHLWSESYDHRMEDIFQVQDEIATAVVSALKITLLGSTPRVAETSPEAYQMYLEGQFFAHQLSVSSLARAIELFKGVVEIDPAYSPAWAELAYAYLWYAGTSHEMSIAEGDQLADRALEKALAADPNNAWAYFVRGMSKIHYKYDYEAGASDFKHALSLDPENPRLVAASGTGARVLGQFDEAAKFYAAALSLDPIMPETMYYMGINYLNAGKLEEAEATFRKLLSLNTNMSGVRYRLGQVLILKGELIEAEAEINLEPNYVNRQLGLTILHHALGDAEESDRELEEFIAKSADEAAYQIAEVYGFREEHDKAFEWLKKAQLIGDPGMGSLLGDPLIRNLRTDARWQPFLESLGLLEQWLKMPSEHGGPVN